ncbi:uncharacterized protein LOC141901730 isoform X2 [Tubulanus polymorphus]|uniref:uncharacterized protein LOC141901730 isoform X2 n=1 Tax=Tubulanus polymorphus TaxID=672921 RepID=UPI003DA5FFF1
MTELTLESVREFLVSNDGKVKNKDMVKHFKQILSDSHNKAENRQKFKEFINELASVRTEDGEKMIILKTKKKKKFMSLDDLPPPPPSPPRENSPVSDVSSRDIPPTPTESSITVESGPTESGESSIKVESTPTDSGVGLDIAPTNESNIDNASSLQTTDEESPNRPNVKDFAKQLDDQIETDKLEQSTVVLRKKKFENHDSTENNENLSLEPLDHKFMIAAACADYHPMAKMLQQNPKLVSQQIIVLLNRSIRNRLNLNH